jgi:hypothetical protein
MKSVTFTHRMTHRIMLFTAVATVSGAALAHAQVSDPVEFTTTFPFTVGNTTMPAGAYEIRRDTDNGTVYRIESAKKHIGTLFEVEPTSVKKAPAKSEVVFKRYGQGYVLKSVWEEGSTDGIETAMVEAERHHVKGGGTVTETRIPARHHKAGAGTD